MATHFLHFSDRPLQISHKGDMDAQNFNFAPKCLPKRKFTAPNLVFWEENFSDRKQISPHAKIQEAPPPKFYSPAASPATVATDNLPKALGVERDAKLSAAPGLHFNAAADSLKRNSSTSTSEL